MGAAQGLDINVAGAMATARALRVVDRNLSERLVRGLRRPALGVAAKARRRYPVVSGQSRRGISVKAVPARKAAFGLKIVQVARGGSIIEFANQSHTAQGATLVKTLAARYGAPGRVLWGAWDESRAQVDQEMSAAVKQVETDVQVAVNKAKGD